ncbi:MAG: DUF5723 family protein, partial [Ignavibacteriales bacterium]|nr:DUF5723 family protein [Ignavibacteriales bacterium]
MNRMMFSTKMHVALLTVLALSVFVMNTVSAGNDRVSPRIVGMGKTFTASSRGLDAIGLNPANLALTDRGNTVTFQFAPFGFAVGSDFLNYQVYNDFFTGTDELDANGKRVGKRLTEQDKQDILALFPGGTANTHANFDITPFALSVQKGRVGVSLSVSERIAATMDLPEGYLKMLLNGFPIEGKSYNLDNTSATATWTREYNLSGAYLLPYEYGIVKNIAVGAGVKIVQGYGYFGTRKYHGVIETSVTQNAPNQIQDMTIHSSLDFVQFRSSIPLDSVGENIMKPVGSGVGFDLGASAELLNGIRVAASITDIGNITWDKNTKAIVANSDLVLHQFDNQSSDTLGKTFKGSTIDTTSFTTNLPTAIHLGGSIEVEKFYAKIPGRLTVAADLHIGLNDEPGNTKKAQFGVGLEWVPIGFLPIRTGFLFGGREKFGWSAGLGFHIANVVDIDLATA